MGHKESKSDVKDQLNQEDKEVETDVAIEKRLSMKTKIKKKRIKRRRLKNSLPCNINKIYIMKLGTLSKKEYKQQCKSKNIKCKQSTTCHIHEGRKNLKKLKSLIKNITPEHPGWKLGLNWTLTTGGFIETLINFDHIREDLVKTKKEVDKFNEARDNLLVYKKEIENFLHLKQSKYIEQNNKHKQKSKYGISSRNPKKKQKKS